MSTISGCATAIFATQHQIFLKLPQCRQRTANPEFLFLSLAVQQISLTKGAIVQEPFDNMHKVWTLKNIIAEATIKSQELSKKNDAESRQSMLELMTIVADATEKISNMRWTDSAGLINGTIIYLQAIKNL